MFSTNLQRREGFLLMYYHCCTAVRYIDPLSSRSLIQCSRPDTRMCKCAQRPSLCTCRHESRAYLHRSASCARSASPQIPSGTHTDSHSPSPARGREKKDIKFIEKLPVRCFVLSYPVRHCPDEPHYPQFEFYLQSTLCELGHPLT